MKTEKYIAYRGKGEHSVNELEKIIEQREEELHVIKSHPTTLPSDLVAEITKLQEQWDENGVGLPYHIQLSRVNSYIDSLFKDQLAKIAEMEREMKDFRELARLVSALNEEHENFKSIAVHIKLARKLLTTTTP